MDEKQQGNEEDVRQVGLPDKADEQLKEIHQHSDWFTDEMTVYKVAVSVALSKGWTKGDHSRFEGGRDSKFRSILLDPDEKLKRLVEVFAPECGSEPYRYSQWLAVAGINYLHQELVGKSRSIVDVLALDEDSS